MTNFYVTSIELETAGLPIKETGIPKFEMPSIADFIGYVRIIAYRRLEVELDGKYAAEIGDTDLESECRAEVGRIDSVFETWKARWRK